MSAHVVATGRVAGGRRSAAPRGGVRSVDAALDVLECFRRDEELGVSDVARRIGVAKSTAHRLLTTLGAHGLTERNPETGHYRLGLHLYELGQRAQDRSELHRAAMPLLEELRQRTGLSVHLGVIDGADCLLLERLQTLGGIPLLADTDRRQPSHCTSTGKAIAAYNPTFARARCEAGFPACTARTIRTARDFHAALEQVRRTGSAVSEGESVPGIASVGVPVRDGTGVAVAALSIVGPTAAMSGQHERLARLLTAATGALQRAVAL